MSEILKINNTKTPDEKGFVDIDISVWLKTETILNVNFSAKNEKTKVNAPEVFDAIKSTFGGVYLKPYIQNGVSGNFYTVRIYVRTNNDSYGTFFLQFGVKDY
jgi:hypothetical protein